MLRTLKPTLPPTSSKREADVRTEGNLARTACLTVEPVFLQCALRREALVGDFYEAYAHDEYLS